MTIGNDESMRLAAIKPKSEFKEQVLRRADRDGVPKVAQDIGITEPILTAWRENARMKDEVLSLSQGGLSW